jgi:hypothetical protein
VQQLFNGRTEGFQLLHEAQVFAYWQARVYEAAFERDMAPDRFRRGLSSHDFCACLLAWHLGATKTAAVIMQRLVAQTHDRADFWRASTGAQRFMARLYEQATKTELDIDWDRLPQFEGYEVLLDPELKGRDYSAVLEWACTEHIAQSRQSKKTAFPFATAIYAPMPIELLTWLKLRRRDGLEHGTHGHPLLESTLALLDPPPPSGSKSELLTLFERGIPHMQAYLAAAA